MFVFRLSNHGDELYHHGIKGQKWGVRRTPEQLGHKVARTGRDSEPRVAKVRRSDTIVVDAIRSGEVSTRINREKQMRHTLKGHPPGRSYIYGDLEYAQQLVNELSGTGEAKVDINGNWTRKEAVIAPRVIGVHVDAQGREFASRAAMIVYSKTGAHIYPRKEEQQ